MSQTTDILEHLNSGKRITPLDALGLFGCMRLAARIAELRGKGHNIKTTERRENGKTFAEYWIPQTGQMGLFG